MREHSPGNQPSENVSMCWSYVYQWPVDCWGGARNYEANGGRTAWRDTFQVPQRTAWTVSAEMPWVFG